MLNKLTMLATLCTLGLVACGPGTSSDPDIDTITLKLSRMENGDLQYCNDETGECQDLPYDGQCVIVEVDIDPATGATCERCITADGEVIDMGCSDTSVGCVLVTLPDPDCVVCAYVNGAIIFSSCIAEDEPECFTDEDCLSADGRRGFCFEGQCVYDEGCFDDGDCPPGFQCVFPPFMDPDASNAPGVYAGTCVPRDIPCQSDADCPSDMMCEMWCWADPINCDPDDTNCMPPEQCEGICVERPYDPCADVVCPDGQHCELACWDMPTEPGEQPPVPCAEGDPNCGGFGGCEPVCVPDPTRCLSDDDCGENERCEMWCYDPEPGDPNVPECDPAAGEECVPPPPCEGVCVPHFPDPCEMIDLDCGEGRHCEVVCYDYGMPCFENDPWCGCEAVCVDDPTFCQSDADCEDGEMCEMWCYDLPIDCTDPSGADCMPPPCEGVCVPRVTDPCDGMLCGPGQTCELVCYDMPCFDTNDPFCGCEPICVDVQATCYSDDECPAGQICELYDGTVPPCDPATGDCDCTGSDCGLWAPGICVDAPTVECVTDEDCLDGDVWNARCIDGVCEYVEQFCLSDADCPAGLACVENPTGIEMGICMP